MADITLFSTKQLLELYALVLILADRADIALLTQFGFDRRALEAQLADGGAVADAARLIVLSGHTGSRDVLALLIRGALVDRLGKVEKGAELRDLVTAAGRLPGWIFGAPVSDAQDGQAAQPAEPGDRTVELSASPAEQSGTQQSSDPNVAEGRTDRRRRRTAAPDSAPAMIGSGDPFAANRDAGAIPATACRDGPGLP